jgi:hypothetical protein
MPRRSRWKALLLVASIVVAGCGIETVVEPNVAPGERPPLHVFNSTTIAVSVTVNGLSIGVVQPDGPSAIDVGRLPPVPWRIEAMTPSGRVVLSMTVRPGQVGQTINADGSVQVRDVQEKVELSCGRLTLFAGEIRPGAVGGQPLPQPGAPGDCI